MIKKMKRFKRTLRLIGFISVMALAGMGVGITGAAPVSNKRGEDIGQEIRTEMPVEKEEEASDAEEISIK
jgi:hypothetical protein